MASKDPSGPKGPPRFVSPIAAAKIRKADPPPSIYELQESLTVAAPSEMADTVIGTGVGVSGAPGGLADIIPTVSSKKPRAPSVKSTKAEAGTTTAVTAKVAVEPTAEPLVEVETEAPPHPTHLPNSPLVLSKKPTKAKSKSPLMRLCPQIAVRSRISLSNRTVATNFHLFLLYQIPMRALKPLPQVKPR